MSNGVIHEKVNYIYLIPVLIAVLTYFAWDLKSTLIMVAGYIIGTYWMNPDLDIKSKPYNNWFFLRFLWKPYRILGHRSIWTHGYIIGDVIRYIYLMLLFVLVSYLLSFVTVLTVNGSIEWLKSLYVAYKSEFVFFFIGNVLSSSAHIFQDHTSSFVKKMKRKVIGKK